MLVQQTSAENLKRTYDITVPKDTIDREIDSKLAGLRTQVKIKGFREGKAPIELVKKQYGARVRDEVLDKVVRETSTQALTQENLTPVMQPKVEVKEDQPGKDLVYSLEFEIYPEIPDIDYASIEIEKLDITWDENDVDEAINRIAEECTEFKPVAGNNVKAKEGHAVKIDFHGTIDDVPFEGGHAHGHVLQLGSGQFIPGFEDQLIGTKAGDDITVSVPFPDDYHAADLAGKDAQFAVKIHEIMESVPASVNDELAQQYGLENLEEMKNRMREQLQSDAEKIAHSRMKETLLDILDERYPTDVPEQMLELEFKTIWQQLEQLRTTQPNNPDIAGKTDNELKEEYQQLAKRRVQLGIILTQLSKRENIQVGQDDLLKAIQEQVQRFPGQEEQVQEYYQKNPQAVQELAGPLLEEKVVDFILEKVKLKPRQTTVAQLLKEQSEQDSVTTATKKEKKTKKSKSKGTKKTSTTKK